MRRHSTKKAHASIYTRGRTTELAKQKSQAGAGNQKIFTYGLLIPTLSYRCVGPKAGRVPYPETADHSLGKS